MFISLCDVISNEGIESLIFIMGCDLYDGCWGVEGKILYNTGWVGDLAEDWGMVIGVNNGDVELENKSSIIYKDLGNVKLLKCIK